MTKTVPGDLGEQAWRLAENPARSVHPVTLRSSCGGSGGRCSHPAAAHARKARTKPGVWVVRPKGPKSQLKENLLRGRYGGHLKWPRLQDLRHRRALDRHRLRLPRNHEAPRSQLLPSRNHHRRRRADLRGQVVDQHGRRRASSSNDSVASRRRRSGIHLRQPASPIRTLAIFGPPGHAYVYLSYGIHECLNIVAEDRPRSSAAAVLIRALQPLEGIGIVMRRRRPSARTDPRSVERPGKLRPPSPSTTGRITAWMLTAARPLRPYRSPTALRDRIMKRIRHHRSVRTCPLRFTIKGNRFVSHTTYRYGCANLEYQARRNGMESLRRAHGHDRSATNRRRRNEGPRIGCEARRAQVRAGADKPHAARPADLRTSSRDLGAQLGNRPESERMELRILRGTHQFRHSTYPARLDDLPRWRSRWGDDRSGCGPRADSDCACTGRGWRRRTLRARTYSADTRDSLAGHSARRRAALRAKHGADIARRSATSTETRVITKSWTWIDPTHCTELFHTVSDPSAVRSPCSTVHCARQFRQARPEEPRQECPARRSPESQLGKIRWKPRSRLSPKIWMP